MRKILGLIMLCLLFVSCECIHDCENRESSNLERIFETEVCTCIEINHITSQSTAYFFIGEKVPVKIELKNTNQEIITPALGKQYKIRYSWWKCQYCQKKWTLQN